MVQAEALRLRLLDFEVFFFGTAMMISCGFNVAKRATEPPAPQSDVASYLRSSRFAPSRYFGSFFRELGETT
jgi:hypothetical protein